MLSPFANWSTQLNSFKTRMIFNCDLVDFQVINSTDFPVNSLRHKGTLVKLKNSGIDILIWILKNPHYQTYLSSSYNSDFTPSLVQLGCKVLNAPYVHSINNVPFLSFSSFLHFVSFCCLIRCQAKLSYWFWKFCH